MAENSTAGTYSIAFVTIKDMPSAQILAQYVLKLQIQMTWVANIVHDQMSVPVVWTFSLDQAKHHKLFI